MASGRALQDQCCGIGWPGLAGSHELNNLYRAEPKWVIETLFASVAATLKEFAANARWMGVAAGQPAFSLVLHTRRQDLGQHLHLHAVMACGVLGASGQWHVPVRSPDILFPVRALSPVFKAKVMAALTQRAAQQAGHAGVRVDANLTLAGRKALYRHAWVVYAKTPLGGPAQVLAYSSRYSHRTAIGNGRIQRVSAQEVVFTVRDNERGGAARAPPC